jgi:tetratricopeptide (TPR) repeat protein
MNKPNHKPARLITLPVMLVLLAACQHIDSVRLGSERPDDLGALLQKRQYERAEQLLSQFPYLDTPEQRNRLHAQIAAYEEATLEEAHAQKLNDDLSGALQTLDAALLNLPHSSHLNDYRRILESERDARLRATEYQRMLARARYLTTELQLYETQSSLASPDLNQRWEYFRNQQEADALAVELLECGRDSLQRNELKTADKCLHASQALQDSPQVRETLARLRRKQDAIQRSQVQQAQIKKVKKEKKLARTRETLTQTLLAQTRQALDDNDLPAARTTFRKIPDHNSVAPEVIAVRTRLEESIGARVDALIDQGDRLYRGDKVDEAIDTWDKALELDPENTDINVRLERARKVLARLEELKTRQQK